MSHVARAAVRAHSTQTGTKLALLLILADMADNDGICWALPETLAGELNLSDERNVRQHIQQLEDTGELAVIEVWGNRTRVLQLTHIQIIETPRPAKTAEEPVGSAVGSDDPPPIGSSDPVPTPAGSNDPAIGSNDPAIGSNDPAFLFRNKKETNQETPTPPTPPSPAKKPPKPGQRRGALADHPRFKLPEPLNTADFEDAWIAWYSHNVDIGRPLTQTAGDLILQELAQIGPGRAIAAIRHSIVKRWKNIYEPDNPQPSTNGRHPDNAERENQKARVAARLAQLKEAQSVSDLAQ